MYRYDSHLNFLSFLELKPEEVQGTITVFKVKKKTFICVFKVTAAEQVLQFTLSDYYCNEVE